MISGMYDHVKSFPSTVSSNLKRPHTFFIIFGLLFGLIFLIVVPPYQVPDEQFHFYKAYQVSEGNFVQSKINDSSGGYLPTSLGKSIAASNFSALRGDTNLPYDYKATTKRLLDIKLNPAERNSYTYPTLASYSPIAYTPQAVAVAVGRIFTDRIIVLFYAARLVNLVCYLVMVYFAIRIVSKAKWVVVVVGLLPMSLFEAASISADSVTLGAALLFAAMLTKYYYQKRVTNVQWFALALVTVVLCLSKQVYFILAPALLILLTSNKTKKAIFVQKTELKSRSKMLAITLAVSAFCVGLWGLIVKNVPKDMTQIQVASGHIVDPSHQLQTLIHQPLIFINSYLNSIFSTNGNGPINSFLGVFGWLNIVMPYWAMYLLAAVILLSFGLKQDTQKPMRKVPSLFIVGLVLTCYTALQGALFVYWTKSSSAFIEGFQGRYFIPLLAILIPVFAGRYVHSIRTRTVMSGLLLVLVTSVTSIYLRF